MGKGSGVPLKEKPYPKVVYGSIKSNRKQPKSLPNEITIDQILQTLPKEVFETSNFRSFTSLLITILFIGLSITFINLVPSYLYPIGWMLMGASVTGLMVIGNDCIHKTFSNNSLVNSIIGTIVMLPLLYPFQSYKISEKNNTANKNKMEQFEINAIDNKSSNQDSYFRTWATGKFFWILSIINWAEKYFSVKNLSDKQDKSKAFASIVIVYIFGFIFFPMMIKFVGVSGFLNYWFAPWLILHFLLSTASLLPSIPFYEEIQQAAIADKNKKQNYLVHITYPQWFEFIVKDINFSLPRQIAVTIPHYNLRKAYQAFKKSWGEYIYECTFEMELFKELINRSQDFSNQIFSPFDVAPLVPKQPVDAPASTRPSRTVKEFLKAINWLHFGLLIGTPIIAIYGMLTVSLTWKTFVWTFIYYHMTGMGITAGYHRLWSHRAYSAKAPLRAALLIFGAGAVEGSCRWWCRDHRAHHRYIDTEKDPYSAHYGFWWSHFGWLMMKQDPKKIGRANIDDLNADPWIMWQHKNYLKIATFMGFIFPTLVAGFGWGDWAGGYFYSGVLRLVTVQHSTFMVNSLAHYLGDTPYDDNHTPKDSFVTAVLTFGEGYHNFHHEFPSDYRNAYKIYQYDPTKWLINILSYVGLAYNLKTFSDNEIQKGMLQMHEKHIAQKRESIYWGIKKEDLPSMTMEEFDQLVTKQNRKLIIINDNVLDVETFMNDHPGGLSYINMGIGKDATKMFTGEVYGHSNAAKNLLCQFSIATISNEKKDN
ncbi:hypothetical protein DICPUDRAFT_45823 [Dictyostelium purpureum]|uniref:Cytochrome b5 heme-binding domain-containing protein n=1 Tax=Dictyostelium purpureum TaxID=5786 RepID=F0ZC48_DICPU|nr:uncharacterized protein DICPUDRAFT_45823 [Dictyostelium purpureum]EGC38433.1 hypothetical protein DICPUDRAFT_45823 [Dictyostelium purpureum]|eukprot:XP_003284991.1 hypothetical protein DICPUDRAFT_45823 [Dictyostelium purpureum]